MVFEIVEIFIGVIFFVWGIIILLGKIDKFIAIYRNASEEERKRINIKRLRLVHAVTFWAICAICMVLPRLPIHESAGIKTLIIMGIFLAVCTVSITLSFTWCKKKTEN